MNFYPAFQKSLLMPQVRPQSALLFVAFLSLLGFLHYYSQRAPLAKSTINYESQRQIYQLLVYFKDDVRRETELRSLQASQVAIKRADAELKFKLKKLQSDYQELVEQKSKLEKKNAEYGVMKLNRLDSNGNSEEGSITSECFKQ
jgi:hypothetical protein